MEFQTQSSVHNFAVELLGRFILILVGVLSAGFRSWAPLVLAPIFWQLWDTMFGRRSRIPARVLQLVADVITYVVWLSYIGVAIVSLGKSIGHWYGWAIGAFVGILVAQVFGLLFPFRWHLEQADELWGSRVTKM